MASTDKKAFGRSKVGVKGLADAGIEELPPMFHAPPHLLSGRPVAPADDPDFAPPVIDLKGARIVEKMRDAAEKWGFFQIVNHGIPASTLEEMKAGVHRFSNLQEAAAAADQLKRKKDSFDYSNWDTSISPTVNWTDFFLFEMAPNPPEPERVPGCIRAILAEYCGEMFKLGDLLLALLSEALGLPPNHLKDEEHCAEVLGIGGHYYPPCPQPELTLGITQHSDVGFITILLQDHVGGLQVAHRGHWVDVPPKPDALVINVGDMLQLISNDKFKSAEHRVVLKKNGGPRVSIGAFFGYGPPSVTRIYAPIKKLLSKDNPPKYRETTIQDFFTGSYNKGFDGTSYLPKLKL
ncbi:unnamed protein product [Linum trigynum]|uniref:Fe2OG dioxygenase domain-containing protein n=1 Tax=Linum trigynum TaxID=586398 RepID=A0AAV2DRC3_9ROSI